MKIKYNHWSNSFSHFKTSHCFKCCIEVYTADDMLEAIKYCVLENKDYVILGNGSNVFFPRKYVRTIIIKNLIGKTFKVNEPNFITVASSASVQSVLKYCLKNQLDSFYYLASVPATVGGAIAMNAGRGWTFRKSILDFVKSVRVIDSEGNIGELTVDQFGLGYRETIFTGINNLFILEVNFIFPSTVIAGNPIQERVDWSKQNQDFSGPNCGSVFKQSDPTILNVFKGFQLNKTYFSSKTGNWIINKSSSPFYLNTLLRLVSLVHKVLGKKAVLEIIKIK